MADTDVNGLSLPTDLLRLIAEGRWQRPTNVCGLAELTEVSRPEDFTFLGVEGMRRETAGACRLAADPQMAALYGLDSSRQRGRPVEDRRVLDTDLAVLIAVNWDEEAIFLDYRSGMSDPSVVLAWYPDDRSPASHREIAPVFSDFTRRIGLTGD